MGSKGQNYAIARGPPKPAGGRARGEGKGECFAPFILKIWFFTSNFAFWGLECSQVDLASFSQKRQIFIKLFDLLSTHVLAGTTLAVVQLGS